jgi:hypothetical protein
MPLVQHLWTGRTLHRDFPLAEWRVNLLSRGHDMIVSNLVLVSSFLPGGLANGWGGAGITADFLVEHAPTHPSGAGQLNQFIEHRLDEFDPSRPLRSGQDTQETYNC